MARAVKYLSSTKLEGRGAGTRGLELAAQYIAKQFAEIGVKTDLYDGTPFQEFETPPNGAGDLTAALFLGPYLRTRDVKAALEGAAAGVFAVIAATHEAGTRELQLIAAQDEIVAPKRRFSAEQIV